MSEAAVLIDICDDSTTPMSREELVALMANGSVASQITCKRSELEMAQELPPGRREQVVADISAAIVSLQTEFNNPLSPTWIRYATTDSETQESEVPTSALDLDSATAFIEELTSASNLGGKVLNELYDLSDALGPVLEEAQRRLLGAIDDRERAELDGTDTVNLRIVPDSAAIPDGSRDEPMEDEELVGDAPVANTFYPSTEGDGMAAAHVNDSEPELTQLVAISTDSVSTEEPEPLIIPDDFTQRITDCLSIGAASHKDIMREVFGIVQPDIRQISILLSALKQLVGGPIRQDYRNGKFFVPYLASPRVNSSNKPEPVSQPNDVPAKQKRRKVSRGAGSWK